MNKEQQINAIYKKLSCKYTKKQVQEIYDAQLVVEKEAILSGDSVKKFGFGTLACATRKSRILSKINSTDNEKINVPKKTTVVFRISKALKTELNK